MVTERRSRSTPTLVLLLLAALGCSDSLGPDAIVLTGQPNGSLGLTAVDVTLTRAP